jgi:hypothetical protein
MGGGRDIPPGASFHQSVVDRMRDHKEYRPINDLFMKDSEGNIKDKRDQLGTVVPPGRNAHATSSEPLRHLEFEKVKEGGRDNDLYSVVRK